MSTYVVPKKFSKHWGDSSKNNKQAVIPASMELKF